MTAAMIRDWLQDSQLDTDTPCVQSATDMLENLEDKVAQLNRLAESLVDAWLAGARA